MPDPKDLVELERAVRMGVLIERLCSRADAAELKRGARVTTPADLIRTDAAGQRYVSSEPLNLSGGPDVEDRLRQAAQALLKCGLDDDPDDLVDDVFDMPMPPAPEPEPEPAPQPESDQPAPASVAVGTPPQNVLSEKALALRERVRTLTPRVPPADQPWYERDYGLIEDEDVETLCSPEAPARSKSQGCDRDVILKTLPTYPPEDLHNLWADIFPEPLPDIS